MSPPLALRAPAEVLGGLVAAAALAAGGLVAASAAPASAAACSGTSGVTVVIDVGADAVVRCASGDPTSGLAALSAVASVTQVQRQPGFVCRIDGAPASDPCVTTPPATAYWSYWHAQPGGSWQYSNVGAGSYDPAPGDVEGWSFGSGQPPSAPPPAPPAPAPPPDPAPAPPSPPGGGGPAGGAGGGSGSGSASGSPSVSSSVATSGSGSGSGSVAAPTARGATGRTTAPSSTSTSAAPTSAAPSTTAATSPAPAATTGAPSTGSTVQTADVAARRADDPTGPSLPPLIGAALVLALGAAAGTVAWRRRAGT